MRDGARDTRAPSRLAVHPVHTRLPRMWQRGLQRARQHERGRLFLVPAPFRALAIDVEVAISMRCGSGMPRGVCGALGPGATAHLAVNVSTDSRTAVIQQGDAIASVIPRSGGHVCLSLTSRLAAADLGGPLAAPVPCLRKAPPWARLSPGCNCDSEHTHRSLAITSWATAPLLSALAECSG